MTRNLEIGNTPVWVLPNIWRLGQVGDTKFGANGSIKMLLNAAKYQCYSFYRLWVIKGKPLTPPTPPYPKFGRSAIFNIATITFASLISNHNSGKKKRLNKLVPVFPFVSMHAGILQTAEKRAYYHKMGLRIEKVVWIQWIQFSSKLMPCVSKRENLNKSQRWEMCRGLFCLRFSQNIQNLMTIRLIMVAIQN